MTVGPARASLPNAEKRSLYPIALTALAGWLTVVVGGGRVAERKMRGLLAADARVRLIAPEVTPQVRSWAESGQIEWAQRAYRAGDLAGTRLVIAATDDRQVNRAVAAEAHARGLLVNVADRPEEGNFHVPAVLATDDALVAVSSRSARPRVAQRLRNRIAAHLARADHPG